MEIVLPQLFILSKRPRSKNKTQQLIVEKAILKDFQIRIERDNAIVLSDGKEYFLTHDKRAPAKYEYVLLTDKIPTRDNIVSKELSIQKWLKHPKSNGYSVMEVIKSWRNAFNYLEEDPDNKITGLRQPQIAALHMIIGHLKLPLDAATVVMPTGTGKTETMLSALVANQCSKLLVIVPSDSLRDQISNKFFSLGLLKQFGIVDNAALYPIVGTIYSKFENEEILNKYIDDCNVVITTMSWLTHQPDSIQDLFANKFSHAFIDEAHHVKANSWNEFRNKFAKEKIVQFTATPFRNDGKRLDGKIIFNFPLRRAQQQGYYKNIEFIAVRQFDKQKADEEIARVAIERLKADLANGFDHILMARCSLQKRADEIYDLYKVYTELNPVVIHSGILNYNAVYEQIISKKTRVIVCVDMLGEGFDLPELKIAAFHDIRKSLPITLQLAGRFTRTSHDKNLGDASFVANIADLEVRKELAELYASDADWNEILSDTSYRKVNEEVDYKDFIAGFSKLSDINIPFQNIKPKLSTVVYKNKTKTWFPTNFQKGIVGYDDLEYKFHDLNRDKKVLVIITGRQMQVDWVNHKDFYHIQWDITIVFWDTERDLLFINSSDNGSLYTELAQAILGEEAELIKGINVFKSFHNIKRVKLQNVGLRQFLGKNIRFRMMMGSDIAEALSLAERQRGEKAFVMGAGYEEGIPVNIGASYKGRIWTKLIGDLKSYTEWCLALGKKLIDPNIDPNQILKETLIPTQITQLPTVHPVWIDWDEDMYMDTEGRFKFYLNGFKYDMSSINIIIDENQSEKGIHFSLITEDRSANFILQLFEDPGTNSLGGTAEPFPNFRIIQTSSESVDIEFGAKKLSGKDFFEKLIPTIWFADGSALTGNEYIELKQNIGLFAKENIIGWDWTGVNLSNESQHVQPKIIDSIQYRVIHELKKEDNDIIYDDDYSGEIADVVTIKIEEEKILIKLYHLKYAADGVISGQIKNFYEVCGQAQKSIHWKHRNGKRLINHLLKREIKSKNGSTCSRLEKGSIQDLEKLLNIIKNEMPVEYEIFIVQPGLSIVNPSEQILTLLGVTENYLKEFADINLKVIANIKTT